MLAPGQRYQLTLSWVLNFLYIKSTKWNKLKIHSGEKQESYIIIAYS